MWPFSKLADKIYSLPNAIFGVSKTYVKRAMVRNSRCTKFTPVYLGADLENYDCHEDKHLIKKNLKDIWVTYIGTLSYSYDIETAIRAFSILEDQNIKLNILGSGPDFEHLVDLSKNLGVFGKNVFFHGRLPYKKMVSFLKKSDIALNSLTADSKGTITTKLGDYIAAGLPLLNSCQEEEVKNLISDHNLGFNYIPGSPHSLLNALEKALKNKVLLREYRENSKRLAIKYFDRKISYQEIVNTVKALSFNPPKKIQDKL